MEGGAGPHSSGPATLVLRAYADSASEHHGNLEHFPIKFTRYRLRPLQFRHSFLAGGVALIQGEVKAVATRHRAWRGFGLEFPLDRGKMTGTG